LTWNWLQAQSTWEEAEQVGNLATAAMWKCSRAPRPKDIVADIRLKGSFSGKFQVPAPDASNRSKSTRGEFDSSSVRLRQIRKPWNAPLLRRKRKSLLSKRRLLLEDVLLSRCFCPCRSGPCASPTARDFARCGENATARVYLRCGSSDPAGSASWAPRRIESKK